MYNYSVIAGSQDRNLLSNSAEDDVTGACVC
jgi:hypothetical protein